VTPRPRLIGAMAIAAVSSSGASAQAPPVFRSEVESVYVDVFVSHVGQPVPGLDASSFELKDNGVRQPVAIVAAESRPVRAALVFDTSSSVVGERLAALKAAGEAFLNGLRPADEVALVGFSEEISWLAPATTDKAAVRRALERLEPAGATAAFDALYAAVALTEEGGRSLIVLFTDGEDNMSFLDDKQIGTAVARSNALVHTVVWRGRGPQEAEVPGDVVAAVRSGFRGLTVRSSQTELDQIVALRKLAEASGGRFWTADSPERLRRAFAEIADAMSHRYILRYEPQGVERSGWHRIDVKLRGHKGEVEARHGYFVAPRVR
jgi:VWFA-related protein